MFVHAKYLVNSFHVTVRVPPEILTTICSHLTTEEDVFSVSQVCNHWRSVLTSSLSLWTQFSCRHDLRTIVSLERCKSIPIRLKFGPQSSDVALANIILHGNKIASLNVHRHAGRMPPLHQLFVRSRPTVEQLHIYDRWATEDPTEREIWQDFPTLRELLLCQYAIPIDHLVAPNLVHLGLEGGGYNVTVKSTLDMLRGCPLLETLLIIHSIEYADQARDHSPVSLPHLRCVEMGLYEVYSGLLTYIPLPPNVASGFRTLFMAGICGEIRPSIMAAVQHVLRRVDIRCITLVAPPSPDSDSYLLVRFEGPGGSLEIVIYSAQPQYVFFGPGGVLLSLSPHINIENVRVLHIVGCPFDNDQGLDHIDVAMPNLVSVSFFNCRGPYTFRLLTPAGPSSPPFPHLERIMVLGQESGLVEMAEARRDFGVPLKTVVIGQEPRGFEYEHLEDYSALGEFVDDLRIGCPTEIVEWGADNEIHKIWSAIEIPASVSPNRTLVAPANSILQHSFTILRQLFRFCRFMVSQRSGRV